MYEALIFNLPLKGCAKFEVERKLSEFKVYFSIATICYFGLEMNMLVRTRHVCCVLISCHGDQ